MLFIENEKGADEVSSPSPPAPKNTDEVVIGFPRFAE